MTKAGIEIIIENVNNYLDYNRDAKTDREEERYAGRAYEQIAIFKKYFQSIGKIEGTLFESVIEMLRRAYAYDVLTNEEFTTLCNMIVYKNYMTVEEAQKIINDEGFAWSVLEVSNGDRFTHILCDWHGEERIVYYSNAQGRIVKITNIYNDRPDTLRTTKKSNA